MNNNTTPTVNLEINNHIHITTPVVEVTQDEDTSVLPESIFTSKNVAV